MQKASNSHQDQATVNPNRTNVDNNVQLISSFNSKNSQSEVSKVKVLPSSDSDNNQKRKLAPKKKISKNQSRQNQETDHLKGSQPRNPSKGDQSKKAKSAKKAQSKAKKWKKHSEVQMLDNDTPQNVTTLQEGAKLNNSQFDVVQKVGSGAKSDHSNLKAVPQGNDSCTTLQSTGQVHNADTEDLTGTSRRKSRNSSQKQKSRAQQKEKQQMQTQEVQRNPKSNKISKQKNQKAQPQTQNANFKKPFEAKKSQKKKATEIPADDSNYALKDKEPQPDTHAQIIQPLQTQNGQTTWQQLNQKITNIFGVFGSKKGNKITYNDSNFNHRKKLQIPTEQDQQNELIADLKRQLQDLKDGKNKNGFTTDQASNILQNLQVLQTGNQQIANKDNPSPTHFDERYIHLKEVGKGTFGSVIKAIDTKECKAKNKNIYKLIEASSMQPNSSNPLQDPQNFVAIKKVFYDRRYEQRELTTLGEIRESNLCDNIIEVKDKYFRMEKDTGDCGKKKSSGSSSEATNQKKEYLHIVTDFLPYTINDLKILPSTIQCEKAKFFCLESIRQVMLGVFKGLKDLHSLGITHRDIKLCNILIDNNQYPINIVKICDFGSSKRLMSDPDNQSTVSICYIGTRSFRAPELLVGNQYYDSKIDIWSAGVIFLKLIFKYLNKKQYMFDVKDTKSLSKVIQYFIGVPTETELKEMNASNQVMKDKSGMSEQEILSKRFKKFDAYMGDKISSDCIDLLHKVFELSPVRRITAEDILKHPFFTTTQHQPTGNKISVTTKQSNVNRTTESTSPCLTRDIQVTNKKVFL